MKITALKAQVKNPERVSVFVDEKYSFSLSLDELVKYKLRASDELSSADVKKYKQLSADGKLRARALEWLLNRPHSTREFKDYLYRKKADQPLGEKLIKDFTDRGYLDDRKFAEWLVELNKRRQRSDRAIRAELFKKGVNRELVDEAMSGQAADEAERLAALIAKKRSSARYKSNPQKLMQYLVQQGFSWPDVKAALGDTSPEG